MALLDMMPDILMALVQKDYVLFAPKSDRGLKTDYPELDDAKKSPEFSGIGKWDMKFIWAWACVSSPFVNLEDRELKLELCVEYAYPKDQRIRKNEEYERRFPEAIKRGIEKMSKYSLSARVTEFLALKVARENYTAILMQNISNASAKEKQEWLQQSIVAQKGLAEQRERIEGMDLGISERDDTMIADAIDLLALHHQDN